jgi:hypothetical protein
MRVSCSLHPIIGLCVSIYVKERGFGTANTNWRPQSHTYVIVNSTVHSDSQQCTVIKTSEVLGCVYALLVEGFSMIGETISHYRMLVLKGADHEAHHFDVCIAVVGINNGSVSANAKASAGA